MFKKLVQVLVPMALLAACDVPTTVSGPAQQTNGAYVRTSGADELRNSDQAERAFVQVLQRLEPVAERECRNRTTGVNCDFRIVVDDRPGEPANAYQTLDKTNRWAPSSPIAQVTIRCAGPNSLPVFLTPATVSWARTRPTRRVWKPCGALLRRCECLNGYVYSQTPNEETAHRQWAAARRRLVLN